MNKVELAYLAGFFDGEGNIGIYYNHGVYHMVIRIVQKNPTILRSLSSVGKIYQRKDGMYLWQVSGQRAAEFLGLLLPSLILKHEQAEKAIEFQSTKGRPGYRTTEAAKQKQATTYKAFMCAFNSQYTESK